MPWKEENIHIHIHNENKEIVCLLREIRDLLKKDNGSAEDEKTKQEIMDKLNTLNDDIKSTV